MEIDIPVKTSNNAWTEWIDPLGLALLGLIGFVLSLVVCFKCSAENFDSRINCLGNLMTFYVLSLTFLIPLYAMIKKLFLWCVQWFIDQYKKHTNAQ